MLNCISLFICAHPHIPCDCHQIITEYHPSFLEDRCYMCGIGLIILEKRIRRHFEPHVVCGNSIVLCTDFFELFMNDLV
jgi:hypothetical protein